MLAVKERTKRVVNILIDPEELEYLHAVRKNRGLPVSQYIRELIEEDKKKQRKLKLRSAALALIDDYKNDKELTAFTSLDAEEFV